MTTAEIISTGELEKKSNPELVDIYNSLNPPKPVKRFADRETAVKRVLGLLAAQQGAPKAPPPPSKPVKPELAADAGQKLPEEPATKAPKSKPKAEGEPSSRARKPFNFPVQSKVSAFREGTKRAFLVEQLDKGATFEELLARSELGGWDARTLREGITLLHKHLGFGLEEKTNGKIYLIRPN